jgi:hypothetical protein
MSELIAGCPRHEHYDEACHLCVTAEDISNMSLHKLGLCTRRCKSMEHWR